MMTGGRGTPKITHFNRIFHYKQTIFGYILLEIIPNSWVMCVKHWDVYQALSGDGRYGEMVRWGSKRNGSKLLLELC